MKLALLKIGLLLFVLQELPSPWARFEPEGAGFSVLMPGKPQETITKRPNYTLYTYAITFGRGTYVATYSDYTPEAKLDPNTALIKNRDKFNKSFDAKLLSSREITVDGHPGIEFTSESPAANLKSQLFLIGNRMYQTATMIFKDADQAEGVERFFSSFKFTITTTK